MKYGMNLLLWNSAVDDSTPALIEQIKGWGYDGVELPLFELDPALYTATGEQLKQLGLGATAVTICTTEENPVSPDAAVRKASVERLKKAVDCCHAAGATTLCGPIHSALGDFDMAPRDDDQWGRAKDVIAEVAPHAQDAGVTLVVEAINRFECYFINCVEDAAQFCREVNHPAVKMMYDTFHANIEQKNITEAVKACADQLHHVHISENDRSTPGEGLVQWDETFAALKEVGYDGWMTIEAFGLALPDLAAATRIWRRMFPSEEHLAVEGLKFMKAHAE